MRGGAPPSNAGALAAAHADTVKVVDSVRKAGGIGAGGNRKADGILQLLQVLVIGCQLLPQVLGKHAEVGAEVQKNLKLFVDKYTEDTHYCCCC